MVGCIATAELVQIQLRALTLASGAWRTSSSAALCVDLNVEPLDLRWSKLLLRWEARVIRLPEHHPLRLSWLRLVHPPVSSTSRDARAGFMRSWNSRLSSRIFSQRLLILHNALNHSGHRAARGVRPSPPALDVADLSIAECLAATVIPPAAAAGPALLYHPDAASANAAAVSLSALPSSIVAFSDGSFDALQLRGAAACTLSAYRGLAAHARVLHLEAASSMPPPASAFAAELFGILLTLDAAATLLGAQIAPSRASAAAAVAPAAADPTQLHIFCDCKAALLVVCLVSPPSTCISLLNGIFRLLDSLSARNCAVVCHWHPGHAGVLGNEAVDASAKTALLHPPSLRGSALLLSHWRVPLSVAKSSIDAAIAASWASDWARRARSSPNGMDAHLYGVKPLPGPPHGCWTSFRQRDRALCLLRLGSCLNAYLHRLRLAASPLCPGVCGAQESVSHFLLSCFFYSGQRQALQRNVGIIVNDPDVVLSLKLLLGCQAPAPLRQRILDAVWLFLQHTNRALSLSSALPV